MNTPNLLFIEKSEIPKPKLNCCSLFDIVFPFFAKSCGNCKHFLGNRSTVARFKGFFLYLTLAFNRSSVRKVPIGLIQSYSDNFNSLYHFQCCYLCYENLNIYQTGSNDFANLTAPSDLVTLIIKILSLKS